MPKDSAGSDVVAPPRRVLIVEDDDSIALALEFVLGREGYAHDRVADGTEALAMIRAQVPDLVLLDVMLPGLSGYEICHRLRDDPAMAGVRILMMTARGSAQDQRRARELGADGFVAKPFELDILRREVRRLLA
ncbi:response regulator transcription factor [Rhodobacter sp. Har01]|uniref:response regulator transcription factor n=1 Tax=Rhodobacter sp. Har01 TaxID=2883999 RepID=UPI0039B671B8